MLSCALLFFLPLSLVACPSGKLVRLEVSADAMGSTFSLVLYGSGRVQLQQAADAAFAEARRLDHELSNYQSDSELTYVNRMAANQPIKATPELFHLLCACARYSRESGGAFDITVGPLMKVWGFYKDNGSLPRPDELSHARTRVGYRHVHLDPKAHTVSFDRPGVELDPGGIGKGYAVDRIVAVLKFHGIEAALVASSRSSIYGLGTPPSESRGWPIDIQGPSGGHRPVATVYLKNMSLSTSGSSQKFFRAQGRTYSHIMDPRAGSPAQGSSLVAVLAPRTIDSEAWTKPFFVNGAAWTLTHKPASARVLFCDDTEDGHCRWLP